MLHHVESAHEGKKTNCPNCKVDVEEGEKHQCTHQCTICNEEFSTKNKLVIHRVNHIESVHGVKKGQLKQSELKRNYCVTCNIEFWDQGSFDTHLLTVHSKPDTLMDLSEQSNQTQSSAEKTVNNKNKWLILNQAAWHDKFVQKSKR